MPIPVHVPRVNNNDDVVQIVGLTVKPGDFVQRGQVLGSVETDKAVVDVEAEAEGYVLKVLGAVDDKADVGSVLMWIGATADEAVPDVPASSGAATGPGAAAGSAPGTAAGTTAASAAGTLAALRPTAKARSLLKELGLTAAHIPASGERVTVADIEAWLVAQGRPAATSVARGAATHAPSGVGERGPAGRGGFAAGSGARARGASAAAVEPVPDVAGELHDLSLEGRGMLGTVLWHRDHAAAAYLEFEYDPRPWDERAAAFAKRNKLLMAPLMPLMAHRLVEQTREHPAINATLVEGRRYQYAPVNLGFTVQVGATLYLTVVRDAQAMDALRFINAMGELQRRAMAHKLRPDELSGATISFSSMARWNVSRHMPILPPQTAMIVAHAAPRGSGKAVLGATYDHRLLSGYDVVQVLQALAQPAEEPATETS
jgi:pyruvate/2-oxoglutarate dehydrogenase complex dihydrolipoamide acyltransferase (E2) component